MLVWEGFCRLFGFANGQMRISPHMLPLLVLCRYELKEKRLLLGRLKKELVGYRELWKKIREKNSESLSVWTQLRDEFAQRRVQSSCESTSSPEGPLSPTPTPHLKPEGCLLSTESPTPPTEGLRSPTIVTLGNPGPPTPSEPDAVIQTNPTDNATPLLSPAEQDNPPVSSS
jgi:hypothetical protein